MSVRRCVVVPPLPVCGTCLIPEGEGARRNPQHTHKYIQHITHRLTHKYTVHITQIHILHDAQTDMEFVQKFTPPDFQAKNFTPSILPYFSSFSKKKHKEMSENGEIYTAGKNFTLPPALTAWTNSTSA